MATTQESPNLTKTNEEYDDSDIEDELLENEGLAVEKQPLKIPIDKRELIQGKGTEFETSQGFNPTDVETGENVAQEQVNQTVDWVKIGIDIRDDLPRKELATYKQMMTDISIKKDGGILKYVLREGTGDSAQWGSEVKFHYTIWVEDLDEPIDSTKARRRIKKAKLGNSRLLPGVENGLSTMKVGEVSDLIVTPEYGFGKLGCPPRIPPDALLRFEIELVWVGMEQHPYDNFTDKQKETLTTEEILSYVESKRKSGKQYFSVGKYSSACNRYLEAKNLLVLKSTKSKFNLEKKLRKTFKEHLFTLHQNLAMCYERLIKKYPENEKMYMIHALTHCQLADKIKQNSPKVLFHWAKLFYAEGEYEKSLEKVEKAIRQEPYNDDLMKLASEIGEKMNKYKNDSKEFAQRMCAGRVGKVEKTTEETDNEFSNISDQFKKHAANLLEELYSSENKGIVLDSKMYSGHEFVYLLSLVENMGFEIDKDFGDEMGYLQVKISKK